ncbi:hypothetical protein [Alkalicoccobacillus porphyridii]|uniref:Sporulation protein n=1 Tax=Alkalicoccobacillus porphyridii TaxID=2597270 RepID=A0A553ZZK0_9BACI|nr:hypothetical protein [Alkalicoccobacillus porphyridii]TSB46855.1 hypothetical protein FN960_07475 [Alkalicoccobacillus porphyridii]
MKHRYLAVLLIVVFITGCGEADNTKALSTEVGEPVQRQAEVDEAKQILLSMEEIKDVKGVQYTHLLFLAPDVKQFDRLKLEHVRQEAFQKVKKEYPNAKVHVSTDKKIYMELDKLERKLYDHDISEEELKNKLMKLEEDMKG